MKKKTLILFFLIPILCFSWSCRQKIKLIPEITPHIIEEIVFDLKDKEAVGKIAAYGKKLIFVTLKGEIFRFDPEKKILDFLVNFGIDIDPEIFTQNNFIVLKQQNSNNYTLFNLATMKLEKKIDKLNIERIISVDDDLLVYKDKNKLFFFDYRNGETKKELEIERSAAAANNSTKEENRLFNSESYRNTILILSNRKLYIYDKRKNSIEAWEMKDKPTTGFLLDGRHIYFGTENRKLVKFSLKSKRASWKFNLPVILKLKPQKTDRHIIITPEDNNLYFFNKNGTLRWWTSFDSTQVLPAIVMKKNVAVFLMNRQYRWMNNNLRFFNYKDEEVVSFEFKYQLESNPVYLDNFIYILCKGEEKGVKYISKIGNKYDIELEIKPEKIKSLRKSISFIVKPINLINPEAKFKILDSSQNSIFTKDIANDKALSFIWIPEKVGNYKCTVEVNAENKKNLKAEEEFKVVDIDRLVNEYYFELFKNSRKLLPMEKEAAGEKDEKKDAGKSGDVKAEGEKGKENQKKKKKAASRAKKKARKGKGKKKPANETGKANKKETNEKEKINKKETDKKENVNKKENEKEKKDRISQLNR